MCKCVHKEYLHIFLFINGFATYYLVDQLNDPLYCSLTLRPNQMSNQPSDGPVLVVGDVIEKVIERQIIDIEKINLGINKK